MASDSRRPTQPADVGLCAHCVHQRVVRTGRGSAFSLCERSRLEPQRFPKYPRVPVTRCAGFATKPVE